MEVAISRCVETTRVMSFELDCYLTKLGKWLINTKWHIFQAGRKRTGAYLSGLVEPVQIRSAAAESDINDRRGSIRALEAGMSPRTLIGHSRYNRSSRHSFGHLRRSEITGAMPLF